MDEYVPFDFHTVKSQFHKYDQMFSDMGKQIEGLKTKVQVQQSIIKAMHIELESIIKEPRAWTKEDVEALGDGVLEW